MILSMLYYTAVSAKSYVIFYNKYYFKNHTGGSVSFKLKIKKF